jgi:hypothetical protein
MRSPDFAKAFGKVVRKHRKRLHLSQEELAEKADLASKMISLIDRFERNLPPSFRLDYPLVSGEVEWLGFQAALVTRLCAFGRLRCHRVHNPLPSALAKFWVSRTHVNFA